MSSWIYSFLFVLYAIGYIKKCHSHYDAYTQNRYRFMLYGMDRELIRDSLQKVRSVQFMKSYYTRSPSFHVAERIFNIRRKFAIMVRQYTKAYSIVGNKTDEPRHIFLQSYMIKMQRVGMDIDHLVEMLTEWEEHSSKNLVNIAGFNVPLETFKMDPSSFPGLADIPGGMSAITSFEGFDRAPGVPAHPHGPPGSAGPGGAPGPGGARGMGLPPGVGSGGGSPPPGAPAPSGPARARGSRVRAGKFRW